MWPALTDSATLSQWTLFESRDLQPIVGHKCQFVSPAGPGWDGIIECEVLEVDAPHRLSYTWAGGPENLVVHTIHTWTLTETGAGLTRLHLEQSGFDPSAKRAIGGARYAWNLMPEQLQARPNSDQQKKGGTRR